MVMPSSRKTLFALGLLLTGFLAACGGPPKTHAAAPLTYYLSPSGNDAASGTSPESAWKSLRRASSASLRPGTRLLLEGGKKFTGQLRLSPGDGGDPARPVRIGSYGRGLATIISPGGAGIVVFNISGIDISDLVLVGEHTPPSGAGVNLYSNLPGNRKLDNIAIDHVDVSGFGYGIAIGGGNGSTGFRHVRITYSTLHNNLIDGLLSYGPRFNAKAPSYAHADIQVSHVAAFRNYGDPADKKNSSGSGLVLGSVQGATISSSAAYDNGGSGGDRHEGPQGIWAYDSTDVVIEHNLSYRNRTRNLVDGGGFDLDQNTSNSYLQYNVSYGNDGAGYILYTHKHNDAATRDVVRFNISSGDARKWSMYAGITVLGRISDSAIYQNTVVGAARSGSSPSLALRLGKKLHGITARNNIFATYQPGPVVVSSQPLAPADAQLQGNDYFSAAGGGLVRWGAAGYSSLGHWRSATRQEVFKHKATGFHVDPGFAGPVLGLRGTSLSNVGSGFRLRGNSPLLGSGLDLYSLFGIRPGSENFSGQPIAAYALNIGAE